MPQRRFVIPTLLAPLIWAAASLAAPAADPGAIARDLTALRGSLAEIRRERDAAVHLAQLSPNAAARLDERLAQIERSIADLTAKLDDLNHRQREAARENEKFRNDMEYRLEALEKGRRGAAPPRAPQKSEPPPKPPQKGEAPPPRRAEAPTRGNEDEAPPRRADAQPGGRPTPDETPPKRSSATGDYDGPGTGSPTEDYQAATGQFRQGDYAGAATALQAFVARYHNHPLTASAYYWLGEAYFVRGQWDPAIVTFADGFKRFPNHAKAPDNLLRLGMAFARSGKKGEACATFAEFNKRFARASQGQKNLVERERRQAACGA
jgi:tol-pal system protein YbgF